MQPAVCSQVTFQMKGTSYLRSQFVVELRVYFLSRVARGVKNNQPWVGTEQKVGGKTTPTYSF